MAQEWETKPDVSTRDARDTEKIHMHRFRLDSPGLVKTAVKNFAWTQRGMDRICGGKVNMAASQGHIISAGTAT